METSQVKPLISLLWYPFRQRCPPEGIPGSNRGWTPAGFDPWVAKIPWRRAWQPTPIFLPGESPWTEEPGRLQSMGSKRVRHDWVTKHGTAQAIWWTGSPQFSMVVLLQLVNIHLTLPKLSIIHWCMPKGLWYLVLSKIIWHSQICSRIFWTGPNVKEILLWINGFVDVLYRIKWPISLHSVGYHHASMVSILCVSFLRIKTGYTYKLRKPSSVISAKKWEEDNRMGKARDLFKKMRDTKGTYHSKIGTIKNRNGMDLSEAEDIKKRWQGYTEELCKKIFTTQKVTMVWSLI